MKLALVVLLLLAIVYGVVASAAFFGQRAMIYPATKLGAEPRVAGAQLEAIPSEQLGTVHALHFPAPPNAPTIVHFHGNGEELVHQEDLVRALSTHGLGVLAVEYPGYGLDQAGVATESNIYAAAECALKHLQSKLGVPVRDTILQGQSLGSGVAVEMAQRGYGAGLVLISPFTSMVQMASIVMPFLPVKLLLRDRYDSLSKAATLKLPTLIIHGTEDEVIPFHMGQRMAQSLPQSRLITIDGAHHNDLWLVAGDQLVDEIARLSRDTYGATAKQ